MAYDPAQIAAKYPELARVKIETPVRALLCKAALAGAFVALAVLASHVVAAFFTGGTAKLIAALLFPSGLAMVLLAGSELFTGNCLLPLAAFSKKITWRALLGNWALVYVGNVLGALAIAALTALARPDDPAFWSAVLRAAEEKASLPWLAAFARAVLCNILVCIAVWMSYAADTPQGKITAMYFPVALFVLCGMEHCVANAYTFSAALLRHAEGLTIPRALFQNLLPVTLGNIVGGAALTAGALWGALFAGNGKRKGDEGETKTSFFSGEKKEAKKSLP